MTGNPYVGLLGCGRWGRHILRDLTALGCRVHVADPSENARRHAESAGARTCESLDGLPDALDGYVIAAPTIVHAQCVSALLNRDAPVFCEKPLTIDSVEARRLCDAGAGRLFVMHKWRYHPGVIKLGELARSGRLGRLIGTQCVRKQWGQPHLDVDGVWILAPHDLSILIGIHGHLPEPVWAAGGGDGESMSWMTAALGAGETRSTLDVSCVWPVNQRIVCVTGEDAIAYLPSSTADHVALARVTKDGEKTRALTDEEIEKIDIPTDFPLYRELAVFIDHLKGGPPPATDAAEGLAVVETLERLRAMAGFAQAAQ